MLAEAEHLRPHKLLGHIKLNKNSNQKETRQIVDIVTGVSRARPPLPHAENDVYVRLKSLCAADADAVFSYRLTATIASHS